MSKRHTRRLGLGLLALLAGAAPSSGAANPASDDKRIAQLEAQVQVLAEELERLRTDLAVGEPAGLSSQYGLGPAASKVYQRDRGLSIGGYGEVVSRFFVDDQSGKQQDTLDALRLVLYAGYKFSDRIVFSSEIEFEHATTSSINGREGSASVESATLDFLLGQRFNLRGGLLLVPMGFVNEIHEPPFFYGVQRPEPERLILPSTWREGGAGVFGSFAEDRVSYRAYVMNSLNGRDFDPNGLRAARQKGNRANAEDLALVARLDFQPLHGLLVGGSVFLGDTGQNLDVTDQATGASLSLPDAFTTIWELHAQYRYRGLHTRALWTQAHVDDAAELTGVLRASGDLASGAVAERMVGGYGEVAYDVMSWLDPDRGWKLEPFYRFEYYDTQNDMPTGFRADRRKEVAVHVGGLQFRPHPQVVIKLDYRNFDPKEGSKADEVQLGLGWVF
jgi:hypothetical protein